MDISEPSYQINAMRRGMMKGVTGITVCVRDWNGRLRTVDIACLTKESLTRWLEIGDKRPGAEAAIKLLLEYK